MRKLLNTLYVTTPEAYLAREGLNLLVRVDNDEKFRIPIHNLEGVVTFGYSGASPGAIQLCAEQQVGISFLSPAGRFIGRVSGPVRGNILLRRTQYRKADQADQSLALARIMIFGKITNCRNTLQRHIRQHDNSTAVAETSAILDIRRKEAFRAKTADELRGIEGDAAARYFSVFNELLTVKTPQMQMNGRSRRPPADPINALLSFCYALLAHEVQSALESVGLDPYCGFLHTDRPGRASLALDMMEEFRPCLADRLVLALVNRRQISPSDFIAQSNQSYLLKDEARKELITTWQKRKKETITHPYLNENVEIGLLPHIQAMLLARYLRGDIDNYPVYVNK